jgi:hypothetical protein
VGRDWSSGSSWYVGYLDVLRHLGILGVLRYLDVLRHLGFDGRRSQPAQTMDCSSE